jgi:hypothetical protein
MKHKIVISKRRNICSECREWSQIIMHILVLCPQKISTPSLIQRMNITTCVIFLHHLLQIYINYMEMFVSKYNSQLTLLSISINKYLSPEKQNGILPYELLYIPSTYGSSARLS